MAQEAAAFVKEKWREVDSHPFVVKLKKQAQSLLNAAGVRWVRLNGPLYDVLPVFSMCGDIRNFARCPCCCACSQHPVVCTCSGHRGLSSPPNPSTFGPSGLEGSRLTARGSKRHGGPE